MNGLSNYSMFELISISELDAQTGIRRCVNKEQYFQMLSEFSEVAPNLIVHYLPSDLETKTDEIIGVLAKLQELLIAIEALHLSWRVERFSSSLKNADWASANSYLATTQEQVKSLSKKIDHSRINNQQNSDEHELGIASNPLEPSQALSHNIIKPKADVKCEAFEKLNLLVDNFELNHAVNELDELMKYSYCDEIDETLERIHEFLIGFNYADASASSAHLLSVARDAERTQSASIDANKPVILAVDDLVDVLNTIKAMLKKKYNVYGVTNHESALKFLGSKTPDLIFLDIEMPDMDGFTLLTLIKKLPAHKDTPIVFLTGSATPEHIEKAQSLGASDFIKKPVDLMTLCQKIDFLLKNKPHA